MSAAQWSPIEDDTADLLALVALGPLAPKTADDEWSDFLGCLRRAAVSNGAIFPNRLRPPVRGAGIKANRVGAFTHRALSRGLVAYTGTYEISDDTEGRNSGKPTRVLRWVGESA